MVTTVTCPASQCSLSLHGNAQLVHRILPALAAETAAGCWLAMEFAPLRFVLYELFGISAGAEDSSVGTCNGEVLAAKTSSCTAMRRSRIAKSYCVVS